MKKYYYITPENEQRGPVEAAMLASCGVDSNTMVWTEGMANWQPAGELPELAFFILSASTPPPFNTSQSQQPFGTSQQAYGASQAYDASQSQQANNPSGGFDNAGTNQGYTTAGNVFTNTPGGVPPIKPDNNLVWAILSTICCCLPLGIVSIVYASRVNTYYYSGNYAGAQEAAENAKNWAIYSCIAAVVVNAFYYIAITFFGLTPFIFQQ